MHIGIGTSDTFESPKKQKNHLGGVSLVIQMFTSSWES